MKERLQALIQRASHRGYVRALKKEPDLLAWVMAETASLPPDAELAERVYCALHGVAAAICPNGQHKVFNTLDKGFRFCANNCQCRREAQAKAIKSHQAGVDDAERARRLEKAKETFRANYGVDNPMHAQEVRARHERTNLERYGAKTPLEAASVQEKVKATVRARYGVDRPLASPIVQEKIKAINLERYGQANNPMTTARAAFAARNGGLNPFQVPEIAEKARSSMIERYGVEKALANAVVLEAMLDRLEQTHGVRNVMHLEEVRRTLELNNIARYGWPSPNQKHFGDLANEILNDPERFRAEFKDKSLREVSIKLGIAYDTARKWCYRHGVELGRSTYEDAITDFLRGLGLTVRRADRTLIKPYELDILVDQHKVAIEFCGLYWHSEAQRKNSEYHRTKLLMAKDKGWRLITIFEDEWLDKREIVEKRLRHAFGMSEKGIAARKLTVRHLTPAESKAFLDRHHTQGGGAYGFANYGACDGNTIVAVMTFAKPRVALGRKSGALELLRFATDGRNHPGVASKLFAAFVEEHNPKEIVSYADRRWSEGDFYRALGFTHMRDTAPNYWYFHPNRVAREYRFKHRKNKIKDLIEGGAAMSERQIMQKLGFDRIWDCGHRKFIWTAP